VNLPYILVRISRPFAIIDNPAKESGCIEVYYFGSPLGGEAVTEDMGFAMFENLSKISLSVCKIFSELE
jgi:hypothetical protein